VRARRGLRGERERDLAFGERCGRGERRFGERASEPRGFGERCLGERAFGERGLGDRAFGERALGERAFGERAFGAFEDCTLAGDTSLEGRFF